MAASTAETPHKVQEFISRDTWKSFSYNTDFATSKTPAEPGTDAALSPPIAASRAMLSLVNRHRPFSSATSVLDIACGPGTVYAELFAQNDTIPLSLTAALLGTDISPAMIAHITARQATLHSDDNGTWARVRAWTADATNLSESVPDASQSHVLSQMGIFLVPDSDACLREARRVLAPGGIFSMSSVASSAWNQDVLGWVERLHPERRLPDLPGKWKTVDGFRAELERNGFRDVEVHEVELAMLFDDARAMVERLWDMLPYRPKLTEGMSEEEIGAVKERMVKHIEETYPDGKLPGTALVAIAF